MSRVLGTVVAVLVMAVPTGAAAQSLGPSPPGYREYVALLGTPIGSLPPLATYTLFGLAQGSPQVAARYGYVSDMARPLAPETGGHAAQSLDSFGLSGILSTGLGGTLSATAGLSNERCTGCSGSSFMASIGGDYRLVATSVDAGSAMRVTAGVNGEIGFGNPAAGSTWSADLGVPLTLNLGDGSGTSVIPFITPSIAFLSANGGSDSDVRAGRLLLGGGVALFNPKSALSANVGFQYVFVSHTQVQVGVVLSYGGR